MSVATVAAVCDRHFAFQNNSGDDRDRGDGKRGYCRQGNISVNGRVSIEKKKSRASLPFRYRHRKDEPG